ncbi:KinB-signaling pathway activation protein [Gorillibacterium massiliense]|uniref:KinB-signaling pathway activation protein n=1 Tax=Gorillibacterium massiliense TaxID=1280390 RepID=UPI0004B04BC3|nr:KinB-signaling pathway activation protein [Gorillibacterium massiliense]
MTMKKLTYWFWSTLAFGLISGGVFGLLVLAGYPHFSLIEDMKPGFNLLNVSFVFVSGALIGIFSQMGFFAYQIIRYLMMSIFRRKWVWEIVQLFVTIVVAVDVVYVRLISFKDEEKPLYTVILPIAVLVVALAVCYVKVKQTNRNAFIPTLFFMFAVTILEAVPALRVSSVPSQLLMLSILLVCNGWQILLLHKLTPTRGKAPALQTPKAS